MLALRQYLCRHDYQLIGKDKVITASLYQCNKCKVYLHHHWILPIMGIKYKEVNMINYYMGKEMMG